MRLNGVIEVLLSEDGNDDYDDQTWEYDNSDSER
jgi:hypothetical protein